MRFGHLGARSAARKGNDMTKEKSTPISRRAFLGTASVGAAASVALGSGSATPAFAQQTGDDRTRARYQATEHVETYYRTNRYYPRGTN
jgi:nitrous oxide reductase